MIDKMGGYAKLHAPKHGPVKCVGCGKFIGMADFDRGRCDFEPLSEFGPEKVEWSCWRCVGPEL